MSLIKKSKKTEAWGSMNPMPDLVIDTILQFLPTKASVHASFLSKQWQGVLSSVPVLNFDEDDDLFFRSNNRSLKHYTDCVPVHKRFMSFLAGYLEYRKKGDRKALLDKLRLCMRMYSCGDDDSIINQWLEVAFARGVKELDIRLRMRVDAKADGVSSWIDMDNCYCLSRSTFANAKSLTSLHLDRMKITKAGIQSEGDHDHDWLLPSLKTMSLNAVWLDDDALPSLLSECPSLEHLSVIECAFENSECHVPSSSLRSLEVKLCRGLVLLEVCDVAHTLESFTFFLPDSGCAQLALHRTFNLKRVDICAYEIRTLTITQSHCTLEATIDIRKLLALVFNGHLTAKVCVQARKFCFARIVVGEILNKKADFPRTISFLRAFGCCEAVVIANLDSKALVAPECFPSSSPSLESCRSLVLEMPNSPPELSRDYLDLMDSLRWIAPSAEIISIK